jgi:hypothetical protein
MLDSNGDIVIKNNKIQMIEGDEVTKQKIETVLGTNKGEWVLNPDEGINFRNITGKYTPTGKDKGITQVARYYESEIAALKSQGIEDEIAAQRLQRRLDGED